MATDPTDTDPTEDAPLRPRARPDGAFEPDQLRPHGRPEGLARLSDETQHAATHAEASAPRPQTPGVPAALPARQRAPLAMDTRRQMRSAARLYAVQAQDPRGFRLAVRSRSTGLCALDVDAALNERRPGSAGRSAASDIAPPDAPAQVSD